MSCLSDLSAALSLHFKEKPSPRGAVGDPTYRFFTKISSITYYEVKGGALEVGPPLWTEQTTTGWHLG